MNPYRLPLCVPSEDGTLGKLELRCIRLQYTQGLPAKAYWLVNTKSTWFLFNALTADTLKGTTVSSRKTCGSEHSSRRNTLVNIYRRPQTGFVNADSQTDLFATAVPNPSRELDSSNVEIGLTRSTGSVASLIADVFRGPEPSHEPGGCLCS